MVETIRRIDDVILTPEKAVLVGDSAIISDLHLGIENALEEKGISIPKIQVKEIIDSVDDIIKKYNVKRLIIAGDVKHEFSRNLPYEWEDVRKFIEKFIEEVELIVIRGNHDNYLSAILARYGIELKESYNLNGWTIVHGHKECKAKRIIMGHEHPVLRVRHSGAVYSYPCYLYFKFKDGGDEREILVLPSFSPILPGSDILSTDDFLSPIISKKEFEVYAIEDEVYALGRIDRLKRII